MAASTQWRDRASGFLNSSSIKLRSATQTAGIFVGDVAKDAGSSVAGAAERAGTAVRALLQQARQQQLQQQQQRKKEQHYSQETVQDRLRSAASSTSTLLKRSFLETKEKVAVGKAKVEEAAKRAAQRSRSLLSNIERWQKGQASEGVFGVPLETVVQRQKSPRPIPHIVIKCVDFLVLSGLSAENIFKQEGDQQVVQRLMLFYDEDWNASIPEGVNPVDVATLLKVYLQMLPEPLLTFSLYEDVKEARSNVRRLRDLLKMLPPAHYSTLECLTALLLRISQKSTLNKMDGHSLAFELAPVLLWRKDRISSNVPQYHPYKMEWDSGTTNSLHSRYSALSNSARPVDSSERSISEANGASAFQRDGREEWCESGGDVNSSTEFSTQISLDDEPGLTDFAIVEAVQCLIEQHNAVFADAIEAIWQELGG